MSWVVVCKTEADNIVKLVGPFDDSTGAHDWRDENWQDHAEIRRVMSR